MRLVDGFTPIPVAAAPLGIGVNPSTNRIYVACVDGDLVSVIDGSTNTVIASVGGVGSDPSSLAVNVPFNQVYVAARGSNQLFAIDGGTNQVLGHVSTGTYPTGVGFVAHSGRIYVANQLTNDVTVVRGQPFVVRS